MRSKDENIGIITQSMVISIIKLSEPQKLPDVVNALEKGGVKCIEVTMTTPGALEAISSLSEDIKKRSVIGVGSVLDEETARLAILAGAEFVVSPIFKRSIIQCCRRYNTVVVPGVLTPTEIMEAWEQGADFIKIFPASNLGPKYIKNVLAPLPGIRVIPTGGIEIDSASDYILAGASAVGIGGNLVDKKAVASGQYEIITEKAKTVIENIQKAINLRV